MLISDDVTGLADQGLIIGFGSVHNEFKLANGAATS